MDFSGKYACTVWYGKEYPFQGKELFFDMEIEETDNFFTGIAIDIDGTGVSPDEAKVAGIINGIHIEFDKMYKRHHYSDDNGNTVFEEKEGFPIYYEGTYNDETGFYEGTWKYNVVRRFLFFFRKPVSMGSGTFQIKKIEV